MTALAAGSLGRADLIVLGHVDGVRGARGIQVVRVRPERVLKGETEPGALTIFVGGPRPTNDRRAPSVPYFAANDRSRYVFFLVDRASGRARAWHLDTRFPAHGLLGEEKVQALVAHVALASVHNADERARRTLAWLLDAQADPGTWTRVHTARELSYLHGVRPDLFDASVRTRVQGLARRSRVPMQRTWLARLLQSLPCPANESPRATPSAPVAPDVAVLRAALEAAEDTDARLKAYRTFLGREGSRGVPTVMSSLPGEPAELKIAVLELLAHGGCRRATAWIRASYAREDDPRVLLAILRAVGMLGAATDVPWLVERLGNARLEREVLFALARIRSQEAIAALETFREAARADPRRPGDIVALVDYLLSSAFVEVEQAAGRGVGPERD